MSLPYTHLLPRQSFYHIGLMMVVMGFMTLFSTIGFISVQTMTAGWYKDVSNRLTIEISAIDEATETIFTPQAIAQNVVAIKNLLANDPIIQTLTTHDHPRDLIAEAMSLNLPLPVFITLTLNPERAINAEDRIIRNIKMITPQTKVTTAESWQRDIDRTALSLQILFGGLALSLVLVSIVMIYAIIAAQLKAHEQTITLIHLMGADSGVIAGLFQKGIFMPICLGTSVGLALAFLGLMPFLSLIDLDNALITLLILGVGILVGFVTLGLIVTKMSVMRLLWRMP